ncbi:MAG: OprO/OprP family phosphate-selective porin [Rhizomicrobium sp.]
MRFRVSGALLAGASVLVLASASAQAAAPQQAKIDALQQQIDDLNAQVADLKRSTSDQYSDVVQRQGEKPDVIVSLKNGRPSFKSADGDFSLDIRALVQFDSAYYGQGKNPAGVDFSSGSNFRRARLGVQGTLFKDWSYQFIYDFGGSGTEGSSISAAYIQYDGWGPLHWRIGAYPTPESFDDTTSASDLVFLERAQPTDLARSIAGSDGRDGTTLFAYDDNYFAAISYTGDLVQDSGVFDEQQAAVGRVAYRLFKGDDANFAIGADSSYVFKIADTAAGAGSPKALRLRERPELNVDDNNIRLIDTGTIDADKLLEWGVEAAGNWRNFYAQGGYFGFDVTRRDSALPDPSFNGWYVQASWVLTGESKPYNPSTGSYGLPKPRNPLSFDKAGTGAWELAARYSVLDLNDNAGTAGLPAPLGGVRGGEQKIWTAGVNWYPNNAVRFVLDYQHTDVSRLNAAGGDIGAKLDAVSLRAQFAL